MKSFCFFLLFCLTTLLHLTVPSALAQSEVTVVKSDSSLLLGNFVAIGGEYAVVNKTDLSESAALVLKRDGANWNLHDTLYGDPDATSNDPQGFTSGAMDENRIIFGDAAFDYPSDVNGGRGYVFVRDDENWSREGELVPSDVEANDDFGISVDISGEVAIVGAVGRDDLGNKSGAAYIFRFDGASWQEEQKLLPADGFEGQEFGLSVAVDDDYAVVGVLVDNQAASAAGAAYVFEYDGSMWNQTAKLVAADPTPAALFGFSVAADGGRILAGAQLASGFQPASGAAYVFEKVDTLWQQVAKLAGSTSSSGGSFGFSVALDGNCAVAGAYTDNQAEGGAAYSFALVNDSWMEIAQVRADSNRANNQFGYSVAVSGGNLFVGAPFANIYNSTQYAGAAYLFEDVCNPVSIAIESAGDDALRPGGELGHGYPNPFVDKMEVPFYVDQPAFVEIRLYDVLGRERKQVLAQYLSGGEHRFSVSGEDLPAGLYFVRMQLQDGSVSIKKIVKAE